jgi:hypothetical protein
MLGRVFRSRARKSCLLEGQTNALPGTFMVPFAFYSGTLGPSAGFSIGNRGFFQPQASAFATVVGSAEGPSMVFWRFAIWKSPGPNGCSSTGSSIWARFSQIDIYQRRESRFSGRRGRGATIRIRTISSPAMARTSKSGRLFGYVLPMGGGAGRSEVPADVLRDGLVVEGARDTSSGIRGGAATLWRASSHSTAGRTSTDEAGDVRSPPPPARNSSCGTRTRISTRIPAAAATSRCAIQRTGGAGQLGALGNR